MVPWLLWPSSLTFDEQRSERPRNEGAEDVAMVLSLLCAYSSGFPRFEATLQVTPAFQNLADGQTVRGSGEPFLWLWDKRDGLC